MKLLKAALSVFPDDIPAILLRPVNLWWASIVGFVANLPQVYVGLFWLMVIDWTLGTLRAFVEGRLNSQDSFKGVTRKVAQMLMVAAAALTSSSLGLDNRFGVAVASAFCVSELLSIVENSKQIGVPIPDSVMRLVRYLQEIMNVNAGDRDSKRG